MRALSFFSIDFEKFLTFLFLKKMIFEKALINGQREGTNLGIQPGSLPEESSSNEPKAIVDAKLIFHYIILNHAGVRVVPLIWRESCHNK